MWFLRFVWADVSAQVRAAAPGDRAAFNSAPWLAVRGTPWSSRVRPHFIHTRRTMYRRVDP